jgi:hypothetical protein
MICSKKRWLSKDFEGPSIILLVVSLRSSLEVGDLSEKNLEEDRRQVLVLQRLSQNDALPRPSLLHQRASEGG